MTADESHDDRTQTHVVLTKGTAVSHYRIIEKIGSGGMGEVYLAEDTKLDRKVALKFLPPHLCQDEDCRRRFTREAQAAAKLDHANIVAVHEVGEFQGRPFFSMQHIDGCSLREVIKQGKLTVTETIALTIQICEGLQEAHEAGIIHRDIKPSNIIIDRKGRPKLLDFGLAAIKGTDKLTKTGSTLGTAGYMSPEQAEGRQTDQRSDLFSLGIVLYEMIAGRRPFDRESDIATGKAIITETPEPLTRYKSDLPEGMQQIVDRALDKNLETRYQTASGLLADLRRLVSSENIGVPRPKRISKPALISGLLALVIVVVWGGPQIKSWLAPSRASAKSIAVVDFDNVGSEEDAYLASGLAEELSIKLRQLEGVQVASSADIRRLAKENLLPREIASRLKVQYALGGSLLRQDSLVRVNVELIDKESGKVVWSDQINKQFTEIFQFLDEVSLRIAQALEVRFTPVEEAALVAKPTDNTGAYDHYLRGRHYYYNITFRDNELAEREFEQALQLDLDYGLALAGLADVYVQRYKESFDYDVYWLDTAKALIQRALILEPQLPEAYESLAELYLQQDNLTKAGEAAEKTRELRPDWDEPFIHLGDIFRSRGLRDTAILLYNRAISLRPNVDALCGKGEIALTRGQMDLAESLYKAASELNPYHDRPYLLLASLYAESHEGERVDSLLRRAIEVRPDHITGYEELSYRIYRRGSTQEGEDLLREFVGKYPYNWHGYLVLHNYVGFMRLDIQAAHPIVEDAARNNPRQAWAYVFLAYTYALMANPEANTNKAQTAEEKAIAAIQTALKLRPGNGEILDWAGFVYIKLRRPNEATKFLDQALQSGPLSSDGLNSIAWSFYAMGEYERAVEVSLKAVAQSPGVAEYYTDLGLLMEDVYRSNEYLSIIKEAASRYGDDPDFFVYLSEAQRSEGQFEEAIASAKRALLVKPRHVTLLHLGVSQWLSGDVDGALSTFRRASDESSSGHWIVGVLKSEGKWDEIESYLKTIKEPRPDQVSGVAQWAEVAVRYYMSMRRYDDALNVLKEFKSSGNEVQPIFNSMLVAMCYARKGQIDAASHILVESAERSSEIERKAIMLEQALLRAAVEHDIDGALNLVKSARRGTDIPDNAMNSQILRLQHAAGYLDDAARTIELFGPRSNWDGGDLYRKAQLAAVLDLRDAGLYLDQAITHLARISRAHLYWNPQFGAGVSFYALALSRAGRHAKARREVERALKLEPEREDIAYNATCAYSLLGDTTLALQWLQTAVERGYLELWWARVDPDLDPLRNLPRFKAIMNNWDGRIKTILARSGKKSE
ncbi:MAG TPA: protein kinase [Sedimentisphaerales bacterium]|nr:protein kinase [Sedimentisphaerales bacterium]